MNEQAASPLGDLNLGDVPPLITEAAFRVLAASGRPNIAFVLQVNLCWALYPGLGFGTAFCNCHPNRNINAGPKVT